MTGDQRERRRASVPPAGGQEHWTWLPKPKREPRLVRLLAKSETLVTVQVLILFFCLLATVVAYCVLAAAEIARPKGRFLTLGSLRKSGPKRPAQADTEILVTSVAHH